MVKENVSEKASKYPKLDAVINFMNAKDYPDHHQWLLSI